MLCIDFTHASPYFPYLAEILDHLGMPYLPELDDGAAVILVDGTIPSPHGPELRRLAAGGAMVVALGGVAGLPDLFGADPGLAPPGPEGRPPEAWLRVEASGHPYLEDQTDLLHSFGGVPLRPHPGTKTLGLLLDKAGAMAGGAGAVEAAAGGRSPLGAGLTARRVGQGWAVALGTDLAQSVVRIQQGWPVQADGPPAADGTVPIDDGILKADDGVALDYEVDRTPAEEGPPYFGRPIADQWRELLLRLILWAHAEAGRPAAHLWYWPAGTEAVAHISLDTDMCGEEPAYSTLAELEKAGIQATFCVIYPEEWTRRVYEEIRVAGHEVGFHYNGMQDTEQSHWGESYILHQVAEMARRSGQPDFVTTKQHVFRWQGEVDTFRLLEAAGLRIDGSKGGSKVGNYGFPFGSCHTWFPIDVEQERMIPVLELPLLTMDMAYRSPLLTALRLMETVWRYHGVAHYGPHPIWIHTKPEVKAALHALVAHARSLGTEFWTSAAIDRWERARRQVRLTPVPGGFAVDVPADLPRGLPDAWVAIHGGRSGESAVVHGRPARMVRVPLRPGTQVTVH